MALRELSEQEQDQTDLKLSQAICFFLMASTVLVTLYMYLDIIRPVFTILILFSSTGCASLLFEDFVIQRVDSTSFWRKEYKLWLIGTSTMASIIGTAIGFTLSLSWYFTHNWMLNNTLALILAITFLKTLRLTTLIPGLVLLSLLFFYDIFWVFLSPYFTSTGQSVMMVVATGLDIPIKIVMPHLTSDYPTSACSLLGLGDILIPGIFIAFLSRFGFEVANTSLYFNVSLIAYSIALLACGACLWIFHAAQPALLYIVPALFIATGWLAQKRNEWEALKRGLPKEKETEENDPFRESIKDIERDKGMYEMTTLT